MSLCSDCPERAGCAVICEKVDEILSKDDNKEDLRRLVYVSDPDVALWERSGDGAARRPVRSSPWADYDEELEYTRMYAEKMELRALRPLLGLKPRDGLIFIGKSYFGMNPEELSDIFGLSDRRVYEIIQGVKEALGHLPDGEAVSESGGDTGGSGGGEEDDMP